MKYKPSEFLIDHPHHTSIDQRIEENRRNARRKAGLIEEHVDIKIRSKDPTTKFIEKPKIYSKTLLDTQRKEEILKELKKLNGNLGNLPDVKQRIDMRENCKLRLGYKEEPGKTKHVVDEERKRSMIDNMVHKFGNVTVGIHGQELPKYNQDSASKEWWRI